MEEKFEKVNNEVRQLKVGWIEGFGQVNEVFVKIKGVKYCNKRHKRGQSF